MRKRIPFLRSCIRQGRVDAWESRSLPGTLAGIAAVLIAAVILYVSAAKPERSGIVSGVIATVGATILVVGAVFLWHLARAPGKLYELLQDENADLQRRLSAA